MAVLSHCLAQAKRLSLLAVLSLFCWGLTLPAKAICRDATAFGNGFEKQLKEEQPAKGQEACTGVWLVFDGEGRIGLFVGNNPINRIDPYGLAWYDGIAALTGFGGAGTFSAAWGGFGSSWGDSSQSMWNAFKASNGNELADAYNGGIFDQTQNADPFTYYGTRAAVATAAAATAAAVAVDAAGLSTRIACHGPHHEFGPLGRLPHVQLNWWQAGVKGSGGALRIPVPPGTPGFPP